VNINIWDNISKIISYYYFKECPNLDLLYTTAVPYLFLTVEEFSLALVDVRYSVIQEMIMVQQS